MTTTVELTDAWTKVKRFKIVILGDEGVGKSQLVNSIVNKEFSEKHHTTLGVDFFSKTLAVDDEDVVLQIWDTSGAPRFHALLESYVLDSNCLIIVYDATDPATVVNVPMWIKLGTKSLTQDSQKLLLTVIVANKVDRVSESMVEYLSMGKRLAIDNKNMFYAVSAKNHAVVEAMFSDLSKDLLTRSVKKRPFGQGDCPSSSVDFNTDMEMKKFHDKDEKDSRGCLCPCCI